MSPTENFTSFCYPAHIPGNAYGFNSSGFVFTINALVPKKIALARFRKIKIIEYDKISMI